MNWNRRRLLYMTAGSLCVAHLIATDASAAVAAIGASKDATLYESTDGSVANGAGQYFFAGTNSGLNIRRGLLWFDVASVIPDGAIITNIALTMNVSRSAGDAANVALHRALADWGEGASNPPSSEGQGAAAQAGDTTWLHTFYSDQFWANPGGDFDAVASATTLVDQEGFYTWSNSQMLADVEAWIADPSSNFGWFALGDETVESSAKRFDSRQSPTEANRPQLTITYIPAPHVWCVSALASAALLRRRRLQ